MGDLGGSEDVVGWWAASVIIGVQESAVKAAEMRKFQSIAVRAFSFNMAAVDSYTRTPLHHSDIIIIFLCSPRFCPFPRLSWGPPRTPICQMVDNEGIYWDTWEIHLQLWKNCLKMTTKGGADLVMFSGPKRQQTRFCTIHRLLTSSSKLWSCS